MTRAANSRDPLVIAAPVRTPIGCTAARLVVTLVHGLERDGGRFGVATLCVSGGMGLAALVERPA